MVAVELALRRWVAAVEVVVSMGNFCRSMSLQGEHYLSRLEPEEPELRRLPELLMAAMAGTVWSDPIPSLAAREGMERATARVVRVVDPMVVQEERPMSLPALWERLSLPPILAVVVEVAAVRRPP